MPHPIRILVADHNRIFRQGLSVLFEFEKGLALTAVVSSAEEAVNDFTAQRPDLTLMDLDMPENTGLDAIRRIRENDPEAWIIALVTDDCDARTPAAIAAGASLVLTKDSVGHALLPAIYSQAGRTLCPAEASAKS